MPSTISIYYFLKQRFPRREKPSGLRVIFDEKGKMPDEVLHDDNYFENFRLKLAESLPAQPIAAPAIAHWSTSGNEALYALSIQDYRTYGGKRFT
jgi:hypothetical protein